MMDNSGETPEVLPLPCPTEEDIATFIDRGAISSEQRDAMLGHFTDCEDCYRVFVDTIQFQTAHLAEPGDEDPDT